jgi:hypothetical protein
MKSVFTLALSALAANALDSEAYTRGFTQQFGITQSVVQDGYNCVAGIQGAASQVLQLIQENRDNVAAIILQAQGLVEELQAGLVAECEPVAEDVAAIVAQTVGDRDVEEVVKANAGAYFPQLVQKVAQYVQYLTQGEDEKAGQTEAYIIQVLLGAEQPETLSVPEVTEYAPFDEQKFLNEYYTAFYNTLGLDANITELTQCVEGAQTLAVSAITLAHELPNLDFDDSIVAVKNFVDQAAESVRGCEGSIELQKEILYKALEAANGDYLGYILESVENVALNLPEYIQLKQKSIVEVQEGEYALAGEDEAKAIKIVDGGRVFVL